MQRLLYTALAYLISVSLSAQEQVITYPYNPDADSDSLIAVPDALEFLTLYGNEFIPEPVMVDGVVITEWFESNSNSSSGGGCDSAFPEGLLGEAITIEVDDANVYNVPIGKRLYITNSYSQHPNAYLQIDDMLIARLSNNDSWSQGLPIIVNPNQVVSSSTAELVSFNGILVEATDDVVGITWLVAGNSVGGANNAYTVPDGKKLFITNSYGGNTQLLIDEVKINYGSNYAANGDNAGFSLGLPLIVNAGQLVECPVSFEYQGSTINGYLVDEDYFADCGGGGGSSEGGGGVTVSTFGDTLTVNGVSVIVPGVSVSNFPESLLGAVTDINLNTYQTVILGNQEWMTENLRVTNFSNGDMLNDNSGSNGDCYTLPGYKNNLNGDGFRFYNAIAVHDSRNICPTGWHIPTKEEFETLLDMFGYLDNNDWYESSIALKSIAPYTWEYSMRSNASMLNFKPDGIIYCGLNQMSHVDESWIWTSTVQGSTSTWNFKMNDSSDQVYDSTNTNDYNLPCRCIKD